MIPPAQAAEATTARAAGSTGGRRLRPRGQHEDRRDLADRIAGLDGGADDYLVKPFDFGELLARLRSSRCRPPG